MIKNDEKENIDETYEINIPNGMQCTCRIDIGFLYEWYTWDEEHEM